MQQRDYIERLIQQVAAAVARILDYASGERIEDAERELDQVWSSLGVRRADLPRLDDVTLVVLLGAKAPLGAELLRAEAAIERARGNAARAEGLERRASVLAARR